MAVTHMKRLAVRDIAQLCHEVNRTYCLSMGDTSQLPWDQAPQWQIDSCVAGVNAHLTNPDLTPEQSHEAWMFHKKKDGWKYGPVKDLSTREHPCMVPYGELPAPQRVKDHLFKAVVNTCHSMLDVVDL